MKLYRCTMEKWSDISKRWIFLDLEHFNHDALCDKITDMQNQGWHFKHGSWLEMEATDNQIATGKYIGMIA